MVQQSDRQDFTIKPLEISDRQDVVDFLRKYMYKDEPMCSAIGITESEELEQWFCGGISEGCSFKALNESGELVAVKLNGLKYRSDQIETTSIPDHNKIALLQRFVLSVYKDLDFFAMIDPSIDRMLEGRIMSVSDGARNQGLATLLYRYTTDWMLRNGVKHMSTLCSSKFTARACEKWGYKEVIAMEYTEFVEDGVCPVIPKEPHTMVRVFLTTV